MGIAAFHRTPKKLDDIHKMEGYVVSTMYSELTWPKTGMNPYCFIIYLDNNESAYINYDLDIIKAANIKNGDYCIVWTRIHETMQDQNNIIEAITVNDMPIIKFHVARWPYIIIVVGVVFLCAGILAARELWRIVLKKE